MRFETIEDLSREIKAALFFKQKMKNNDNIKIVKLEQNEVDFKILKNNKIYGYIEVKGRKKNIKEAYPLPVAIKKLHKLQEQKSGLKFLIWACNDGIIVSNIKDLTGTILFSGRKPREGSVNDLELMAYFKDSEKLKKIYYENN